MVTDIAPVDLMLQRMGRLHRHRRGEGQSRRPEKLRSAYCYVAGVENWDEVPPKVAKGIENVYPRALLLRSLLALLGEGRWLRSGNNQFASRYCGACRAGVLPGDMQGACFLTIAEKTGKMHCVRLTRGFRRSAMKRRCVPMRGF